MTAEVPFTWAGFRGGAASVGALALSSGVYGLAFGVLADQNGLGLPAALTMSVLVSSGSAQMVAMTVWADPVPILAVIAAMLAVNARYILMGAALRPWFERLSRLRAYGSLFFLFDGNWALSMREYAAGRLDAAYLFGGGFLMFLTWVVGTVVGHQLGSLIADPKLLAIDFMLPAFCAAVAVAVWRGRGDLWPFGVAAAAAVLTDQLLSPAWSILAGSLAGSLAGAWRYAHAR